MNRSQSSKPGYSVNLEMTEQFASVNALSVNIIQQANYNAVTIIGQGEIRQNGKVLLFENLPEIYNEASSLSEFFSLISGSYWLLVRDGRTGEQALFNDYFGIQPCFYSLHDKVLHISDNLQCLKNHTDIQCSISKQAIYDYFFFHCIPAPNTIYQQCRKLIAGQAVKLSKLTLVAEEVLYRPQFATQCTDPVALQQECLNVTESAVKQYVSDTTGAFLSGGLDSSTVAGMLAKHKDNAATFSIGFETSDYDETPYAKITAKHFNTDHSVLYLKPEQANEAFVKVAQYFDEPFGNSSAMAAYFCATFAKTAGIDTLLAGDGGDELFAGNTRYTKQKVFEIFYQAPGFLQAIPRALFCNSLMEKIPGAKKVASYIKQADIALPHRLETYNFINQFGAENMFEEIFLGDVDQQLPEQQQERQYEQCSSVHSVDKMLYLDWKFTLADNDIVKVTKMCELAGVKVVFPLLDKELLEFSCKVPAEVKLPGNQLRDFFKKSVEGFLPDKTLTKSKHGFGLPFGVWMKENAELKSLTLECLEAFKKRNIVKASLIEQALEAHQSVHAGYYGELIWIMVILELWLQGEDFS
jgi:asparagine synthase (glutamine-hydrolysing)